MTSPPRYRLRAGRGYGTHEALIDLVQPGARLLDVGAAGGYLSQIARDRKGARVVALEPDPDSCARARGLGLDVLEGDIRGLLDAGDVARRGPYDQLLLADVLEHTPDPDAILADLSSLLVPGGSAVVSLPNIAYVLARLRLARGVWRYEQTGIFDSTHLRFFTRRTARAMLEGAGLRVERELHIGPASYAIGRPGLAVTRLRPELLASQLVFLARRG